MSLFPTWIALSLAASMNGGSYWLAGVFLIVLAALWLYRPLQRQVDEQGQHRVLWRMAAAGSCLALVGTLALRSGAWAEIRDLAGPFEPLIAVGQVATLAILATYLPCFKALGALRRWRFGLLLGAVAVQGWAAIVGYPKPPIDVFIFLTEGLQGLVHGMNPYAMHFTPLPQWMNVGYADPNYHFDVYAYLPAALLLTAPGVLLGDVRWAMLGAVLLSAVLVRQVGVRMGRTVAYAELGAAAFLCYPGLLHVIQEAWVEPLIVAVWLIGLWAQLGARNAQWLTSVFAGLLLAIKQFTAPLLLPLTIAGMSARSVLASTAVAGAIVVPFFLWNPHEFLWDALQYQLQAPSRADALSLNGLTLNLLGVDLPSVLSAGVPALAAGWAILGALRGASLGEALRRVAGFYLLTFLFGKFAFANYYFLTQATMIVAAVAPTRPAQAWADDVELAATPSPIASRRARVLVFIVAYNAARTIEWVLKRIPQDLLEHDTEVLIIDDASRDDTFNVAERIRLSGELPFQLHVIANPVNQGYGGNQKLGYLYAIEHNFDLVALVHGDGQYAPEALPSLIAPIVDGEADAVFGSRMASWTGALRGGMPLYKYLGNRVLTGVQNLLLGSRLTEFHSGYRLYSVDLLKRVPFQLNNNGFHFDTEIIIQLLFARARIRELPIPTYYGDEKCHVNGFRYAGNVLRASVAARLQRFNLVYRRNFDISLSAGEANRHYVSKLSYTSTHTYALAEVRPDETVIDVGCAGGYLTSTLSSRGCRVVGIDRYRPADTLGMQRFYQRDLDREQLPKCVADANVVLLLDVVEHLRSPESFMDHLHAALAAAPSARVVVSTGNVGFVATRLMLLLGQFNYGKRGILDLTHTRLFTFASMRRLLEESGFAVQTVRGVPAPIPEVVRNGRLASLLMKLNGWAMRLSRGLFAYQIFIVARPLPTLPSLLRASETHTHDRSQAVVAALGRPHAPERAAVRTGGRTPTRAA